MCQLQAHASIQQGPCDAPRGSRLNFAAPAKHLDVPQLGAGAAGTHTVIWALCVLCQQRLFLLRVLWNIRAPRRLPVQMPVLSPASGRSSRGGRRQSVGNLNLLKRCWLSVRCGGGGGEPAESVECWTSVGAIGVFNLPLTLNA